MVLNNVMWLVNDTACDGAGAIIIIIIIIIIIPGQYLWCLHHDSESLREFARFTR